MPNTTSAKKELRKDKKRRLTNRSTISKIKTSIKKFLAQIKNNEIELANQLFREAQSTIAKASKKHIIHWKKAARLTSRMQQKFPKAE